MVIEGGGDVYLTKAMDGSTMVRRPLGSQQTPCRPRQWRPCPS